MTLEVAVNGRADAVVTFNRRDFRPATTRFGIEVLLPRAAITARAARAGIRKALKVPKRAGSWQAADKER